MLKVRFQTTPRARTAKGESTGESPFRGSNRSAIPRKGACADQVERLERCTHKWAAPGRHPGEALTIKAGPVPLAWLKI
jgi:hypothetical protein